MLLKKSFPIAWRPVDGGIFLIFDDTFFYGRIDFGGLCVLRLYEMLILIFCCCAGLLEFEIFFYILFEIMISRVLF